MFGEVRGEILNCVVRGSRLDEVEDSVVLDGICLDKRLVNKSFTGGAKIGYYQIRSKC